MPASAESRPGRIESLDVARGLMLITSILSVSWFIGPQPALNVHAFWDGRVTGIDWIFPMFVTLSGCGLAFAYRNRIGWGSTFRRSLVLLIVGLAYNAIIQASRDGVSWATLKVTGPLTMYAVLCLAVGLLHLMLRGWRSWFACSLLLAAGYSLLLWSWAQGCADDTLTRACNPSGTWDPRIFGDRMYHAGAQGHDPEGVFAMLGALVSCAVGATAGHLMLSARTRTPAWLLARISACVGVWVLLLQVLQQYVPTMKRLWTPPFALQVGAVIAVVLVIGYLLLDARPRRAIVNQAIYPLVAMGRNSLLMYFGSHALMIVLTGFVAAGARSPADAIIDVIGVPGYEQATWSVVLLAAFMLLAVLLHRRRIYLRP